MSSAIPNFFAAATLSPPPTNEKAPFLVARAILLPRDLVPFAKFENSKIRKIKSRDRSLRESTVARVCPRNSPATYDALLLDPWGPELNAEPILGRIRISTASITAFSRFDLDL